MRLDRLLRPRSIAAIGGLQASRVVEQLLAIGYDGEIWPVHPTKTDVHGVPAYPDVGALPGAPDAAFIGVNRGATVDVVKALAARGCGGGVCFASGFEESDDVGHRLQSELVAAAGDMPLLGPNCYGYLNYADGALLWPDQHGGRRLLEGERGVAIVSQSSNIAINFTMQRRGLPLAHVFTVGNQALVGISELALGLLEDPRVTTLGIYLERFDSVRGFEELGRRSRELGKPVVVFHVGASEGARVAAMTHTASLIGPHAISTAFIDRLGFGRADSIPVFLEALKLLHVLGPLGGRRVSSMSCSGGEAAIIADSIERCRLEFAPLGDIAEKELGRVLGPRVSVANPLDYHTYSWGDGRVLESAYTAMVGADFDLNYLILDFPHPDRCDDAEWTIAADAFVDAVTSTDARGAIVASMPENVSESYAEDFHARGVACLFGIDEALRATEIAADIGAVRERRPEPLVEPVDGGGTTTILDEAEAKAALAEFGVPIPRGGRAVSVDEVLGLAGDVGYPVVVKGLGIAHKTEVRAVRPGLAMPGEVEGAVGSLLGVADCFLVEAMVDAGVEVMVGITRDPQFGLALTVGGGGIQAELLGDVRTLLVPARREEIETALRSLRMAPLFDGYRGAPAADVDAAIDAILAVQDYAVANAHRLVEVEINPLIIGARGFGVHAVDALVVMEET